MNNQLIYQIGADLLLVIHILFVLFVVVSLPLIIVGKLRSWVWVKNPWFRCIHLLCIGIVVVQSWLGIICPLTVWEMSLRSLAGEQVYAGTFISYWLSTLLYYRAPEWVFILVYSSFGLLVGISWLWVRPRPFRADRSEHDQ